jgi:phosphatidylglycerol:prolipoprotein diacylglycerol transferase
VGLGRIGCFLNGCCYGGVCDIPWAVQFPVGSPAYIDQVQRHELYLHGLIFHGAPSDPPIIEKVEPGSGAEQAGLALHERVTAIGGERVTTVDEAQRELMRTFGAGARVSIDVAGSPRPKEWVLTGPVPRSLPVHPTQLYSLFDALLLCFLLLVYEPYKRWDGELAALVMTIHPITRFLLEIIRVDESAVFNTGMSISQNISLAIFVGGMALWAYLLWRRPRDAAWPTSWAVAGS